MIRSICQKQVMSGQSGLSYKRSQLRLELDEMGSQDSLEI